MALATCFGLLIQEKIQERGIQSTLSWIVPRSQTGRSQGAFSPVRRLCCAVGCDQEWPHLQAHSGRVGALNFQTFSHVAFAFRITPDLMLGGIIFALVMGVAGGVPPAVRAARSPVAATLRGL